MQKKEKINLGFILELEETNVRCLVISSGFFIRLKELFFQTCLEKKQSIQVCSYALSALIYMWLTIFFYMLIYFNLAFGEKKKFVFCHFGRMIIWQGVLKLNKNELGIVWKILIFMERC